MTGTVGDKSNSVDIIAENINARVMKRLTREEKAKQSKELAEYRGKLARYKAEQKEFAWRTQKLLKDIETERIYVENINNYKPADPTQKRFITKSNHFFSNIFDFFSNGLSKLFNWFALKLADILDFFIQLVLANNKWQVAGSLKVAIMEDEEIAAAVASSALAIEQSFDSAKQQFINNAISKDEYLAKLSACAAEIESYLQEEIKQNTLALDRKILIVDDYSYNPLIQSFQRTNKKMSSIALSNKIAYLVVENSKLTGNRLDNSSGKRLMNYEQEQLSDALIANSSHIHSHKFFHQMIKASIEHPWRYFFQFGLLLKIRSWLRDWLPFWNDDRLAIYNVITTLYEAKGGREAIQAIYTKIYKKNFGLNILSQESINSEVIKEAELENILEKISLLEQQKKRAGIGAKEIENKLAVLYSLLYLQNEMFVYELQKLSIKSKASYTSEELRRLTYDLGLNLVIDGKSDEIVPASAVNNKEFYFETRAKKMFYAYISSLAAAFVGLGILGAVIVNGILYLGATFGLTISFATPVGITLFVFLVVAAGVAAYVNYNAYNRSLIKFFDSEVFDKDKVEAKQSPLKRFLLVGALGACIVNGAISGGVIAFFGVNKTLAFIFLSGTLFTAVSINPAIITTIAIIIAVGSAIAEMAIMYKGFKEVMQKNAHLEFWSYLQDVFYYSFVLAWAEKDSQMRIAKIIGYTGRLMLFLFMPALTAVIFTLAVLACFVTFRSESLDTGDLLLKACNLTSAIAEKITTTIIYIASIVATLVSGFFRISLFIDTNIFVGEKIKAIPEAVSNFMSWLKKSFLDLGRGFCWSVRVQSLKDWWYNKIWDNPFYYPAAVKKMGENIWAYFSVASSSAAISLIYSEPLIHTNDVGDFFLGPIASGVDSLAFYGQEATVDKSPETIELVVPVDIALQENLQKSSQEVPVEDISVIEAKIEEKENLLDEKSSGVALTKYGRQEQLVQQQLQCSSVFFKNKFEAQSAPNISSTLSPNAAK